MEKMRAFSPRDDELTPELEIFERVISVDNADWAIQHYQKLAREGVPAAEAVEAAIRQVNSYDQIAVSSDS